MVSITGYFMNWRLVAQTNMPSQFGPPPMLRHTRSLSVDEQGYPVIPAATRLLIALSQTHRAYLVAAACPAWRPRIRRGMVRGGDINPTAQVTPSVRAVPTPELGPRQVGER